jgi:hypothetical protein
MIIKVQNSKNEFIELTLNRLKTLHGEALDIRSNFHKVVLRRRKEAHIILK